MIRMRLTRTGKKRYATWRIVAADSRRHVTAKAIDYLGWYNPHTKEFKVDEAKVKSWFEKGAQPSNTLAILFEKNKIKMPAWVVIKKATPKKIEKADEKTKEAVKAENPVAKKVEAEEVTVEEPAKEAIEKSEESTKEASK